MVPRCHRAGVPGPAACTRMRRSATAAQEDDDVRGRPRLTGATPDAIKAGAQPKEFTVSPESTTTDLGD